MVRGDRIREWRKARKLSARQLGEMVGVNQSFISAVENGSKKCSLQRLVSIAAALDVSVSELLADTHSEGANYSPDAQRLAGIYELLPQKAQNALMTTAEALVELTTRAVVAYDVDVDVERAAAEPPPSFARRRSRQVERSE